MHGDVTLGPFGSIHKELGASAIEQEKIGSHLFKFIIHIVLSLLIADASYLPTAVGNVNLHTVELHHVDGSGVRSVAALIDKG